MCNFKVGDWVLHKHFLDDILVNPQMINDYKLHQIITIIGPVVSQNGGQPNAFAFFKDDSVGYNVTTLMSEFEFKVLFLTDKKLQYVTNREKGTIQT